MPNYMPSDDERQAYAYCVRNNIRISPAAIAGDSDNWYIEIHAGGRWNKAPRSFDKTEVWPEYYNFGKHYYEQDRRSSKEED